MGAINSNVLSRHCQRQQSSVYFNLEMQYVINMGLVGHCYSIFKYFAKELLQT